MKTLIICESTHHGNTKKLCDAIAANFEVDVVDVNETFSFDKYDTIGFASGIAFSKMYKKIREVINNMPSGKRVFFLYTCGNNMLDYTLGMQKVAQEKNCEILGSYGCCGFDTYGPFKLVGGINKNHPNTVEIQGAVDFYKKNVYKN